MDRLTNFNRRTGLFLLIKFTKILCHKSDILVLSYDSFFLGVSVEVDVSRPNNNH